MEEKRKSKTISMSEKEINEIQNKASELGLSFSAFIRFVFHEYLKKEEGNNR